MTLGELIEELESFRETYGDTLLIVMSKDGEGNGYSPLSSIGHSVYVPDTTWRGELYLVGLTDELEKQGFTEEDLYDGEGGREALVFWPVN